MNWASPSSLLDSLLRGKIIKYIVCNHDHDDEWIHGEILELKVLTCSIQSFKDTVGIVGYCIQH